MLRRLESYLIHRELQNCPLKFGELSGDVDQDQVAVHEPA